MAENENSGQRVSGFPPGYDPRTAPRPAQNERASREAESRAKKISSTFEEIKRAMPGYVNGEPVGFDSDGLPDIHEEAAASAPAPTASAQPVYVAPPEPPKPVTKARNPVIEKLYLKFGLQQEKIYDLKIYADDATFSYSMTRVPDEVAAWAVQQAQNRLTADGNQAATAWFQLLFSCAAVVAVDGEPVWRVFADDADNPVVPNATEKSVLDVKPYALSNRLRKVCAWKLANIMWSEISPLGDKLWEFYEAKVSPKIRSSMDEENDGLVRYVCPLDGCTTSEFLTPKHEASGASLPYFCRDHGVQLVETADFKAGNKAPLI